MLVTVALLFAAGEVNAQDVKPGDEEYPAGLVWYGAESTLDFKRLASYCAPVLWFSPDEPRLRYKKDGYFGLPMPLPFEEPTDSAVVYFRVTRVVGEEGTDAGEFWVEKGADKSDWVLDLKKVKRVTMHFFFYYDKETGVGAHDHDFETLEMSINILNRNDEERRLDLYGVQIKQVIGHAHGVPWFFNVLVMKQEDNDVIFPVTILVEEGKHANCTDRNGDGFYSPGYDVNKRVNDAWGVKDVIRSGVMLTPNYETWMTKIRFQESRIAPPLPEDSPWYERFTTHRYLAEDNKRQYTLRPTPDVRGVDFSEIEHGNNLKHFIESKGYPDWPEAEHVNPFELLNQEMFDESFLGSYGYGYRYDGKNSVFVALPLLLTRNFEAPYIGGWFVNRLYANFGLLAGDGFQLWGHQITYTPSASRWMDPYFSAGYEVRDQADGNDVLFVYEAGTKFRAFIGQTPARFLRKLGSDFWGARIGVRAVNFPEIEQLSFVIEVGAGVW